MISNMAVRLEDSFQSKPFSFLFNSFIYELTRKSKTFMMLFKTNLPVRMTFILWWFYSFRMVCNEKVSFDLRTSWRKNFWFSGKFLRNLFSLHLYVFNCSCGSHCKELKFRRTGLLLSSASQILCLYPSSSTKCSEWESSQAELNIALKTPLKHGEDR